jgi:hypothetical protein
MSQKNNPILEGDTFHDLPDDIREVLVTHPEI